MQAMAMEGFKRAFCHGPQREQCIRASLSEALGGPDKVPPNMMPNGQALSGTSDTSWSMEVRNTLMKVKRHRPQVDAACKDKWQPL